MRPPRLRAILTCGLLALAGVASSRLAVAQATPPLGPKDGAGLPPLDTSRVAVGTLAPDFTLESMAGGTITLSQFRGKKEVILVFYRGHW